LVLAIIPDSHSGVLSPPASSSLATRRSRAAAAVVEAIQELAGHQDLTTTQRYMHLSPAHKDAAIRLLDRRPVEDGSPFDYAPPAAALRSGRTGEEFGDGLETTPPGGTKPSEVR
jgi:hypothetical protein